MPEKLALNGGEPVAPEGIPYHRPSIGEAEAREISRCLESRYIVGPGPYCEKVETHLEKLWNVHRVLTVTSGTHALELALIALDLSEEAKVIVPSFTYVSTAQAVLRAGAKPVFADIDPTEFTLTPATVKDAVTENTEAIIFVHYGGFPGSIEKIKQFCDAENISLIEDAAQAFDSSREGNLAGTFGRFGAFSFHGTKSITSGEGGMLVINREEDASRCERIRDKGTDRSSRRLGDVDRYTWRTIGSSYVLSDVLGALLWRQIQRWEDIKRRRLRVQAQVRQQIFELDTEDIFKLLLPPPEAQENGHITALTMKNSEKRNWFLKAMQAEGVQAREHYRPLHLSPYAQDNLNPPDSLPGAEHVSKSLVRLPAHPELTDIQINKQSRALKKVYPRLQK